VSEHGFDWFLRRIGPIITILSVLLKFLPFIEYGRSIVVDYLC